MQKVVLDHVSTHFGEVKAVDDVHLTIEGGELFTLLGPSGCGKTTLLRTIAGFYKQNSGDIYFGDRLINDVPTHARNIGMVFQNYAVFPHLSVFDNVAYGLQARKVSKPEIERRVMEALELVELEHLRHRAPSEMSGGQQQRIALARAIVVRPALLLMDEPLSNLDAKLRVKMRSDIRRMQKDLNITTIYVTHDQEEALAISDRIAVFDQGRVQQVAVPYDLYTYPGNKFVAEFIGETNLFPCKVTSDRLEDGKATVELLGKTITAKLLQPHKGEAIFSIRPEKVTLRLQQQDASDHAGVIETATYLGKHVAYEVKLDTGDMVDVTAYITDGTPFHGSGDEVFVHIEPSRAVIFDPTGSRVIGRE